MDSLAPKTSVLVKVRDLTVKLGDHCLIEGVSFDLGTELVAIMGGSGCGKTTLLNTLSQRLNCLNKKLKFSGTINYYRREVVVGGELQGLVSEELVDLELAGHIKTAYLLQTDVFPPGLTTREYLQFHADLNLTALAEYKHLLIELLLEVLEIGHLADKIINSFTNHCKFSGGERRRVSLAVQLITKPSILFLDEPTTGLDTSSCLKLVHTLRKLTDLGVTVVLLIHQPRPEVSVLFDKICLLTRGGRLVYYGNLVYSYDYFNQWNLIPSHVPPSQIVDFIMHLAVKDTSSRIKEEQTMQMISTLVSRWKLLLLSLQDVPLVPFPVNVKIFQTPRSETVSLATEIAVLTKRTFITTYRDTHGLATLLGLTIFMAIVTGWMFYKPPADLAGIRSYTSSLYVMIEIVGFVPLFIEIERLWQHDGLLFFREYTERYVSITGFIVSRKLGKLLLEDVPVSFAFAAISYFMYGLRLGSTYFLRYLAVTVLVYLVGMASALMCFAWSSDFAVCAMVQNIFYQLQNSACGYFVNASTMPVYVRWLKYICYFWYAFGALSANQFTDWMGNCEGSDCTEYSGNYQLDVLGFPENWVAEPIGILVAWAVGFYVLAAIGLRVRNYDVSMAKQKTNRIGDEEQDESAAKTEMLVLSKEVDSDVQDIGIHLEGINLSVGPGKLRKLVKNIEPVTLLHDISANFDANKVNVIMGPSGSGKTTLLNLLANRLSKTAGFKVLGTMLVNGNPTKFSELSKICCYVSQYDTSLIPHLTVRETFYFQARLRLPLELHSSIPKIINTLIRQMGLLDCADTLIGNENVKGISGGERRRVSIGVQLLNKPKVLFLDEPTSGLDSSTSVAIMKLLDQLTRDNGTTIIATIHQPSNDMFERFGALLLLARGGFVVYNGATVAVENYLRTVGFSKPEAINIADYILDLVSHGVLEDPAAADYRIAQLIQEWRLKSVPIAQAPAMGVDLGRLSRHKLPFWSRIATIARRQLLSSLRSRDALATRSAQVVVLGVIHALFFSPLRNSREGVDNRLGLIQEVLNFYFIGFINNFAIFPVERDLFYQEFRDGIYNNLEFQMVYFFIESVVEVVTCLVFLVFVVFVVGLPRTAAMYFSMFVTCFVSINTGESLGIIVNAIFDHLGVAINVISNLMVLAIFMGGTMSLHMPQFFKAWNYLNPMKYAVGICAEMALRGQEFSCGSSSCELSTGEDVLRYYNLALYLPGYFGGLITCLVVYRIIAVVAIEVKVRTR